MPKSLFLLGPMPVAQPRLFPRHPNLNPGIRPPFMPPPGFQIPVAPQSEPNVSMPNPAVSGAPSSSATSQLPGSAPEGVVSSMAPHHAMMPPMGAPAGALPPHMFGAEGEQFMFFNDSNTIAIIILSLIIIAFIFH